MQDIDFLFLRIVLHPISLREKIYNVILPLILRIVYHSLEKKLRGLRNLRQRF